MRAHNETLTPHALTIQFYLHNSHPQSHTLSLANLFTHTHMYRKRHTHLLRLWLLNHGHSIVCQHGFELLDLLLVFPQEGIFGILVNLGFILDVLCPICISNRQNIANRIKLMLRVFDLDEKTFDLKP